VSPVDFYLSLCLCLCLRTPQHKKFTKHSNSWFSSK
jgi:hypothetical protein